MRPYNSPHPLPPPPTPSTRSHPSSLQTDHTPRPSLQLDQIPHSSLQADHDHSTLSSVGASDSLDVTELSALAEAAHIHMTGGRGGGGGVGRSASEEIMQSRKEREGELCSLMFLNPTYQY